MNCKYLKIRTKKYERYCYCDMLKKEINFNYCKYCDIKAYKEYKAMKQRTYKQAKKDKERYSIITSDMTKCIECGIKPIEKHECIGGKNRSNSIKWGLVVPLCNFHHKDAKIKLKWRIKAQSIWMQYYHKSKDEFIKIFGRYL